MRILVIANHYAVASGRYITDAFKRLGHDVRHTGAPMGREIWGLTLPPGCEWTPDTIEDGWTPDLIVVADSDERLQHPYLHDYRGAFEPNRGGVPTVVWGVDNHVRNTYQHFWADHYFLAHRNVSQMRWNWPRIQPEFGSIGKTQIFQMTHLPCAYDPTLHTPSPIPYADREYDVAILGMIHGYPHRMAAVKELQSAGLKVTWGCGLVGEAYAAQHHNSKIALSLSFNGDVGCRVFEAAAMGCCVLSDNCADFDILKPDGVIVLDADKSLVGQVQSVLDQPLVAQTAIEKAQRWAKPHTWDNRAKVLLTRVSEQMLQVTI